MKKHTALLALFLLSAFFSTVSCFAAAKTASAIKKEALQKDTVQSAILYIKSMTDSTATAADKRSLLYFLGKLEESMGLYSDASRSYASACAIAAGDAEGMPKVSSEQLVLCAVRTSLCAGEFDNADSYLNSAVRSSKDASVLAYVNLYAAWSQLCRAQDSSQTTDTLALLRAYVAMDSMKVVRPCLLFTLWYLTDDASYSDALKKEYASSPEYAIVCGKANVVSVPFWYFVPRAEHNLADESSSANKNVQVTAVTTSTTVTKESAETSSSKKSADAKKRRQVGFFASKANADSLIERLKAKGFEGYFYTETRASGTTYYIVVVDDNADGTMGLKLKDAGFENYLISE